MGNTYNIFYSIYVTTKITVNGDLKEKYYDVWLNRRSPDQKKNCQEIK